MWLPPNVRVVGTHGVKKVYLCFVVAIIALFLGWVPKLNADKVSWFLDNDFAHFYITGKLARQGMNPYAVSLAPLYAEGGFTPTRDIPLASIPPALAVVMAPFTVLPPFFAFLAWTSFQVGALMLGAFIVMRVLGLNRSGDYTATVFFGALAPLGMFAHIRYGQTQAVIFLLVAVGLYLLERSKDWSDRLGLVVWGISASIKIFTLPLAFVALRYRGLAGLGWFVVGFCLPLLPFVALCGFEGVSTFVTSTIPYIRDLSMSFNGNISLSGALTYTQRILFGEEFVSAHVEQIAALVLFIALMMIERREEADLAAATFIFLTASCLLSPTSWPHYLPLLTGGFIYLLVHAEQATRPAAALWSVFGLYVCMSAALGYIAQGDIVMRLVSAWWGPLCMVGMVVMILMARRRNGLFT